MTIPGYRLRGTTHDPSSCGCSQQEPRRIVRDGLSLLMCENCGGLVTHERKPRPESRELRDARARTVAEASGRYRIGNDDDA